MRKYRFDTHHISSLFDATINAEELSYFFCFVLFYRWIYLISFNQLITHIYFLYLDFKPNFYLPRFGNSYNCRKPDCLSAADQLPYESKKCYSIEFHRFFRKYQRFHGIWPQQNHGCILYKFYIDGFFINHIIWPLDAIMCGKSINFIAPLITLTSHFSVIAPNYK